MAARDHRWNRWTSLPWPDEPHLVLWHAQTLLKKGDTDAAQAIAACLVAFAHHASAAERTLRAGMIGLTGCNEDGLAVVVNNLDMLPASPTGLPVAFAIRGISSNIPFQAAQAQLANPDASTPTGHADPP